MTDPVLTYTMDAAKLVTYRCGDLKSTLVTTIQPMADDIAAHPIPDIVPDVAAALAQAMLDEKILPASIISEAAIEAILRECLAQP